jgi:spore coat protein A
MRFDVVAANGTDAPLAITTGTNLQGGNDPLFFPAVSNVPVARLNPPGVPVRQLTLNEDFDAYGRLEQLLGTNVALAGNKKFGRLYLDPATETPLAGSTEVWEIYNLTADTHPMHFHLVNVQVLNRQAFQNFNGTPTFKAAPTPPEPNEAGWKETIMMMPGTVTRIMMKFDLAPAQIRTSTGALVTTPASPRTGGNEYVWHCHILEHEEHDMMRPLVVT